MKADFDKVNEIYQAINAAVGKHQRRARAPALQVIAALRGLRKSALQLGLVTLGDVEAIEREIDDEWVVLELERDPR